MNAPITVSSWTEGFHHTCQRFWRFTFAAILATAINASGSDYYVATDGNDTHDGISLATPLATLQKAIEMARAGDTIHIRGGTYRQQVTATTGGGTADAYLTIQAYGDEKPLFMGSDQVTGWEPHEGAIWKKTGWTINSQQVFCNERYLQQIGLPHISYTWTHYRPVGTGLASMYPGTFFYDGNTSTLYVWLHGGGDPNMETMDVGTRRSVMNLGQIPFVHVKRLTTRHNNGSSDVPGGVAVTMGPDSIIEECDVQWSDFAGLLLKSRGQALHCIFSNNGDVGVGSGVADGIVVRGCVISGNNYRRFNPYWNAGGLKLIPNVSGTIEENEITDNSGFGVWFDACNTGNAIVIRNNFLHNNSESGIFVEISSDALICNNLVVENRGRGIEISGSDRVNCYHNTIVGTIGYTAISLGGVPRTGYTLKNNRVHNNLIFGSGTDCSYDLIIPMDNGGDTVGNTSDFNCIYRTSGSLCLSSSELAYSTLETWRAATGFDLHSINKDPQFNLTATCDYSTSTTSPVVDAGMALPEVTTDIFGQSRPQGATSDMGAYETYWHDTEPPTAPPGATAALVTWNSVRVSWNPASDNIGVTHYQVYRDGVLCADTPGTEFLDTGLAALTTYCYDVIAIDGANLKSGISDVTAILTGPTPETVPPATPQRLWVVAKTAWQITLAWRAATDNVGVTEYWIYRNGRKVGVSGSPRFTDAGLTPVTRYEYRVSALDASGNQSKLSKSLAVKTLPAPVLTVIEQWRLDYFGTFSDSGDAADAFDFDKDGSVNFVEYSLGRNPTSCLGDDGSLCQPDPELDVAADRLVLVIDLPAPTPAEVLYEVWATGDLVNWTQIAQKTGTAAWVRIDPGGTIVQAPVVAGRQITRIQDSVSVAAHSRRMMTLRLSGRP